MPGAAWSAASGILHQSPHGILDAVNNKDRVVVVISVLVSLRTREAYWNSARRAYNRDRYTRHDRRGRLYHLGSFAQRLFE